MLTPRILQLIAIISAIVFFIAILGLILINSPQPPHRSSKQETSTENQNTGKEIKEYESFWQRIIGEPIAFFTFLLFIATFLLAISAIFQLSFLKRSEHIAKNTADAAKKSAEVAEKTLIATQRPWIKIEDVKLSGPTPIIFAAEGINLNISYQLTNVGTTPAKDVKFFFDVFIKNSDKDMVTFDKLKNHCIEMKDKGMGFHTVAGIIGYLFPNETSHELPIMASIPISYFEKILGCEVNTFTLLIIIAHVTYKFPFDDNVHITGAPYLLSRKDGTPIFPPKKDDISSDDGTVHRIKAENLHIGANWINFAD